MTNITIQLEKLREWQSKLEDIDGAFHISEEMYDVIQKYETEMKKKNEDLLNKLEKQMSMKTVQVGEKYKISDSANFKDKYKRLIGATVTLMEKKRTNVVVQVESQVTGFTGVKFNMKPDVLEKL